MNTELLPRLSATNAHTVCHTQRLTFQNNVYLSISDSSENVLEKFVLNIQRLWKVPTVQTWWLRLPSRIGLRQSAIINYSRLEGSHDHTANEYLSTPLVQNPIRRSTSPEPIAYSEWTIVEWRGTVKSVLTLADSMRERTNTVELLFSERQRWETLTILVLRVSCFCVYYIEVPVKIM